MKILLIGGKEGVGKTSTIRRLTEKLINLNDFKIESEEPLPPEPKDFMVVIAKNDFRIIINSATDNNNIIDCFKVFFEENKKEGYSILISSVRDDNFDPREYFFKTINQLSINSDFILEIPLAKITRRLDNFDIQLKWYEEKIDSLLIHTLKRDPFYIK